MESMMMMMFPWWRDDSRSSQRGNSSRILLGSMDKPEMDQKCCSSCVADGGKFLGGSGVVGAGGEASEGSVFTLTVSLLMMRTGSELAERGRPTK